MSEINLKIILNLLDSFEKERHIPKEEMREIIIQSLASAYKKQYGSRNQIVKAVLNEEDKLDFFQIKKVVNNEDYLDINSESQISFANAKLIKNNIQIDDEIKFQLESKTDFGRIAAQSARQTILQKVKEYEKSTLSKEFADKEGQIITGTVERIGRNIDINLGKITGFLKEKEKIPGEFLKQGEFIKAYLYSVKEREGSNFYLELSRTHPKFLEKLFEIESPEVANGLVKIIAIAREPGSRSKVAVASSEKNLDATGALIGQRGIRVKAVSNELFGEKIDIINYSENLETFIEDALSPAKINEIKIIDTENKIVEAFVDEDQYSLAVGRGGQNVRLASKLIGNYKIDIKIENFNQSENDEYQEEKETHLEEKQI